MSKIERIKAETDGLDVLPELLRAARDGWETLSPEHVGLLKWYGLYAHNTGDGHFMMRVKVIQGKLSAAQVETMAVDRRGLRPRDHRLHDAPVLPDPLDPAREHPRDLRAPRAGRHDDVRRLRRHHAQRRRLHGRRPRARRDRRRLRHVRGDPRLLPRQQALLEPAAQVQGLGHGLRRGLRARPDQRHRALRRDPPRTARAASTCASAAASPRSRASRAGSTSSSRPRRRPRSSPRSPRIFRDSDENRKARGKARLKFLVDRIGPEALREEIEQPRRPPAAPRRAEGARPAAARTTSACSRRPTAPTARSAWSSRSAA